VPDNRQKKEDLLKTTFQKITHPDDLDLDLSFLRNLLDREIDFYSIEKRYFKPDGSLIWVFLSVSAVFDEDLLKKGIKIHYLFNEDLHVFCCKNIFYHVLFNLLSNSIKYSSSNIYIKIKSNKFKTLVKIEDDGEGIHEGYHKKVLGPFFRLSTKMNGTGLGLSLCKKMIEKAAGKIGLKSKPSEGSTFWFRI